MAIRGRSRVDPDKIRRKLDELTAEPMARMPGGDIPYMPNPGMIGSRAGTPPGSLFPEGEADETGRMQQMPVAGINPGQFLPGPGSAGRGIGHAMSPGSPFPVNPNDQVRMQEGGFTSGFGNMSEVVSDTDINESIEKNTDEKGNINWHVVMGSLLAGAATALASGGGASAFLQGAGGAATGALQGFIQGEQYKQKQVAMREKEKSLLAGRRAKTLGDLAKAQKESEDFDGWAETMWKISQLQGDATPQSEWQEQADGFRSQAELEKVEKAISTVDGRVKRLLGSATGTGKTTGNLPAKEVWKDQMDNLLGNEYLVRALVNKDDPDVPLAERDYAAASSLILGQITTAREEALTAFDEHLFDLGTKAANSVDKVRQNTRRLAFGVLDNSTGGGNAILNDLLNRGPGDPRTEEMWNGVGARLTPEAKTDAYESVIHIIGNNWEQISGAFDRVQKLPHLRGTETMRGFMMSTFSGMGFTPDQMNDIDIRTQNMMKKAENVRLRAAYEKAGVVGPIDDTIIQPGVRRDGKPVDLTTPGELEAGTQVKTATMRARSVMARPMSNQPPSIPTGTDENGNTQYRAPDITDFTVQHLVDHVAGKATDPRFGFGNLATERITPEGLYEAVAGTPENPVTPELLNPAAKKEFMDTFNEQNIKAIERVARARMEARGALTGDTFEQWQKGPGDRGFLEAHPRGGEFEGHGMETDEKGNILSKDKEVVWSAASDGGGTVPLDGRDPSTQFFLDANKWVKGLASDVAGAIKDVVYGDAFKATTAAAAQEAEAIVSRRLPKEVREGLTEEEVLLASELLKKGVSPEDVEGVIKKMPTNFFEQLGKDETGFFPPRIGEGNIREFGRSFSEKDSSKKSGLPAGRPGGKFRRINAEAMEEARAKAGR